MERKRFLKSLSMFALAAPLTTQSCAKEESTDAVDGGKEVVADGSCVVSPSETEGPFPTKNPASYVRSDIRKGDGVGANMNAKITVVNANNNCAALEGAVVDVWHCDVNGDYSEYGGTQMQSTNYQSVHWFRGRQVTDSNGLVTFQTIFPGWYQGRATHIHVHIYNSAGRSLLVTQIAFQDSLSTTVNTTGSAYGYTKGMSRYTYNAYDSVFSDSVAKEMSTVTGSLAAGFEMSITIRVSV
ncbi:intradiol ring-cleavage dioxygenase [Olivibacter sitiensis]|uniref:dioxygenase family protein n=1 Tax=Olivibacter sitiensis TaxID=376470 RepID=UPI00042621B6|nr:intradiol ring-cleavage dioxygenase [Olivibacter sitiensis]